MQLHTFDLNKQQNIARDSNSAYLITALFIIGIEAIAPIEF